jgi:O-antigen chain-terminating methyltransferase
MKFTLEARGFSRVEVTPLHPYPAELLLEGGEIARRFNDHFYGAQDYAVIGWK